MRSPTPASRTLPRGSGGGRRAGPVAREAQPAGTAPGPAAWPAPSIGPPPGEPAPAGPEPPPAPAAPPVPPPAAAPPTPLTAPPSAASAVASAASARPLAVEGPKASAPDVSFGTPSGFEVPQDSLVTEGAPPGRGPAAAGSTTGGAEGGAAAAAGEGVAGQGGGGAGGTGGGPARGEDGGPGTGDGTAGLGGATGTGSQGGGTGRDGTFAYILRRIEAAKHYPEQARRLGHRGTVAVRFRIGPDGAVAVAEVAASSGSSLLDAASLETVRRAGPLPAVPGWLRVRISYGLAEARP